MSHRDSVSEFESSLSRLRKGIERGWEYKSDRGLGQLGRKSYQEFRLNKGRR